MSQFQTLSESSLPSEFRQELLALPVAARCIYERVYQHGDGDALLLDERLDGVASAIACIADLCTRDPTSGVCQPVSAYDIHTGLFRSGGRELHFKDGRPPIRDMLVSRSGLESVLSLLRETGSPHRGYEQQEPLPTGVITRASTSN